MFICFSFSVSATDRISFDIASLPAHEALTQFARQANTTLLFPYDLASKEIANPLKGAYSLEIGIVKLLEGTGLYPVMDQNNQLSVKPIRYVPSQYETVLPGSQQHLTLDVEEIRQNTYTEALKETYIEKIAIVGTRTTPRNAIESSVPLDVISASEMRRQGNTDMLSMLTKLIPSFNANDQPINDASTLIRPANLRGMSSDHTLVLINGKRRHRSAVITFLGGGLSDGAQGPDISAIPLSGLKQVGLLRDGASAQYGSDAIAGVLNFALKDDADGGLVEMRATRYYEGDGNALQLLANKGFRPAKDAFLNFSAEYIERSPTNRSQQRDDAAMLTAAGLPVADPVQIWGTPKTHYDYKLALNWGQDVDSRHQLYGFANMARRKVEGGFFFRNPQTRIGVNAQPIFADDAMMDGVTDDFLMPERYRWLVADLTPDDGQQCPEVEYRSDQFLHQLAEYQQVLDDPNCFAFNEVFPNGFTPSFGGLIADGFGVLGSRGEIAHGWEYDVSFSLGYSDIDYQLSNSLNPSLGPKSPKEFSPGGARQLEKSLNLDLKNTVDLGLYDEVNLATGFEWRYENYRQISGDEASWVMGPFAIDPLDNEYTGFSIGSNGFPGYRPESAGAWGRENWAIYGDAETWLSDALLVSGSVRFEDYSDFGSTLDGKFSFLLEAHDTLAIRGSLNSGFKAPTVGQSNVINVTTAFFGSGLQDQATLPPTDPISRQLGATPLEPEESLNISVGIVGQLKSNFYFTLDYFNIRLEDRISTTSAIPLTHEDRQSLESMGVDNPGRFAAVKYFTNDFDTTTSGMDWVLNYVTELNGVQTQFAFNYNWTKTSVDRVNLYARKNLQGETVFESNLTPQRIRMIEENIPQHRASLSVSQTWQDFNSLLRFNYFSGYYEDHLDASSGLDIEAGTEVTIDLEVGYQLDPNWQVIIGANNLFDNRPDMNPWAGRAGAIYPSTSPMGINGGLWYGRLLFQF